MAERNMQNITITLTKEEKKALKMAAVEKDVTVSGLVRVWLAEHQARKEGADG